MVAFFSFYRQNKFLINDTMKYLQQSVEQMNNLLEEKLVEVDKRTWPLFSNDSLNVFNESFENMSYDYYKRYYSFKKDILLSVVGDMTNVQSVNFISNNGSLFSSSTMFIKSESINENIKSKIFSKIGKKPLKMIWMGEVSPLIMRDGAEDYPGIMAVRKIISAKTGDEQGIIVINFKEGFLSKIVNTSIAGIKAKVMVMDDEGRYLLTDSPLLLFQKAEPEVIKFTSASLSGHGKINLLGKSYLGVYNTSINSGWKILVLVTEEDLLERNKGLFKYTMIIITVGGLAFIGVSILAALWISWPITELTTVMETAADGDLGVRMQINAIDEIQKLVGSFNKMMTRIQELVEKNRAIEREKNLAEIKALQMQINPHFLYNTLNSIYSLSKQYGVKPVMDMTYSLSSMFRIIFSQTEDTVTIRESVEQLKHYVTIQKIRFEDKLNVIFDIEEEIYACKVPRLLIQPLVENSIVHGIEKKKGKGEVNIIGYRMNEMIKIIVQDDGVGIEEKRLLQIRKMLENDETKEDKDMIALKNVNRRLKLNYGNKFGLNIFSAEGRGTTVELLLPDLR